MINVKDINVRDPFILVEDDTYYLYKSYQGIGEKYPSFVVYKSNDLKEFSEPKYIFRGNDSFWAKYDFWAPEVHKYNGKYYLFASLKSDSECRGTQIFVSNTPDGEYIPLTDKPITPRDWECLDGTLYVENGNPYIVFCHEWLQIHDGTICAMRLSKDLKKAESEPFELFKASDAKWTIPFEGDINYVTDGPFIVNCGDHLEMIWSSFCKTGYAIGKCRSKSILGPWIHDEQPIYSRDGGHAMVFELDGRRVMSLHSPNGPNGDERLHIIPYK